jgi:cation transport ATPase
MGLKASSRGGDSGYQLRQAHQEIQIPDSDLPPAAPGLECTMAIDGAYAATYHFHDSPRSESRPFISHLGKKHRFDRIMLVSGDRESEVRFLADRVGVVSVYSSQSPEEKVAIVQRETQTAKTLFLGDGINDAPALMTATVGIAFGQNSDVTSEAAGAVIMDASLSVDELFHIGRRMRSIGLQSALRGMILMRWACSGRSWLSATAQGAMAQEILTCSRLSTHFAQPFSQDLSRFLRSVRNPFGQRVSVAVVMWS